MLGVSHLALTVIAAAITVTGLGLAALARGGAERV
jgi:hypothetical protein